MNNNTLFALFVLVVVLLMESCFKPDIAIAEAKAKTLTCKRVKP